jgi:hypothetical protein
VEYASEKGIDDEHAAGDASMREEARLLWAVGLVWLQLGG